MIYFGIFLLDIICLNIWIFIINDFIVEELSTRTFFGLLAIIMLLGNYRMKLCKDINNTKYYKILIIYIVVFYCFSIYIQYIIKLIIIDSFYYQVLPISFVLYAHLYNIYKMKDIKEY